MKLKLILLLIGMSLSLHAQQNTIFAEPIKDSIETSTMIWTTDSVEFIGNVECTHAWIEGQTFWRDVRDAIWKATRDSVALAKFPPQRVLPRICSNCLRKEYLFEHVTKQKVESEYTRLQHQMIIEKQRH